MATLHGFQDKWREKILLTTHWCMQWHWSALYISVSTSNIDSQTLYRTLSRCKTHFSVKSSHNHRMTIALLNPTYIHVELFKWWICVNKMKCKVQQPNQHNIKCGLQWIHIFSIFQAWVFWWSDTCSSFYKQV